MTQDQLILAIQNLDLQQIDLLLSDTKSYMNISKSLFVNKLKEEFQILENQNIKRFDAVYKGRNQICNKGCIKVRFLTKNGIYLDLLIESDKDQVNDVCDCNNTINNIKLEKNLNLAIHSKIDEEVNFQPSTEYKLIKEQYQSLLKDLKQESQPISLSDLEQIFSNYHALETTFQNMDLFDAKDYHLYEKVFKVLSGISNILTIKKTAPIAVNGITDYYNLTNEREKLIWYYEHYSYKSNLTHLNNKLSLSLGEKDNTIEVTYLNYEYVLDYFRAIQDTYDYFMETYKPLPEHFQNSPNQEVLCSLENYLALHEVHTDIVKKFKNHR